MREHKESVPTSCPKCGHAGFGWCKGPSYSDYHDELNYWCANCGYSFSIPTVETKERA